MSVPKRKYIPTDTIAGAHHIAKELNKIEGIGTLTESVEQSPSKVVIGVSLSTHTSANNIGKIKRRREPVLVYRHKDQKVSMFLEPVASIEELVK